MLHNLHLRVFLFACFTLLFSSSSVFSSNENYPGVYDKRFSEKRGALHTGLKKRICKNLPLAPRTLSGKKVALTIIKATSDLPEGYPTQGAVIQEYSRRTFSAAGTGGMFHLQSNGTYTYRKTGKNTGVEKAVMTSFNNMPYTTTYTFETEHSGVWVQDFNQGTIIFEGTFTIEPINIEPMQQLAPESIEGLNIALNIKSAISELPVGSYPNAGIALQTYLADGSFTIKGIGPGTLDSYGTYTYTKVSGNTAVEEAIQTSEFFSLPYTMVYTFETKTSGHWTQNFGNGLIRFSGTFDTFPSE